MSFILRRQTAARYSQGIWVKKLALPRPRPETPETLLEVLDRIREDPSFPALAANWLCCTFGDQKSYSGYKVQCEAAWRGSCRVQLLSAYEQAMGHRVKNPGAIFMYALQGGG